MKVDRAFIFPHDTRGLSILRKSRVDITFEYILSKNYIRLSPCTIHDPCTIRIHTIMVPKNAHTYCKITLCTQCPPTFVQVISSLFIYFVSQFILSPTNTTLKIITFTTALWKRRSQVAVPDDCCNHRPKYIVVNVMSK